MFKSTGPHYCLICPPVSYKGNRIDQPLQLIQKNYSGCRVDIASCPSCKRTFQISYKVDKIIDITIY